MGPILSVSVLNANHSARHREYGLLVDVKPPDESTEVGIGDRFKEPIWRGVPPESEQARKERSKD